MRLILRHMHIARLDWLQRRAYMTKFKEFRQRVDEAMDRLFAVDYQTLIGNAPALDRDLGWLNHAFEAGSSPEAFARAFGETYHFVVVPDGIDDKAATGAIRARISQHNLDLAGIFEFGNDPECVWFAGTDGAAYSRNGDQVWRLSLERTGRNAPFAVSRFVGGTPIDFAFDPHDRAGRIQVATDSVFEKVATGHDIDLALDAAVAAYTRSVHAQGGHVIEGQVTDSQDDAPTIG